jgi:hypothetical protein
MFLESLGDLDDRWEPTGDGPGVALLEEAGASTIVVFLAASNAI